MRIERIIIDNYRQYKHVDLEFKQYDNDVHVVVGKNGVGKTTLLNAINWCLYDDEPHAYASESSIRLLNLNLNSGTVSVEVQVRANNGVLFKFKRSQKFVDGVEKGKSKLETFILETSGETKHFIDDDAEFEVVNFVQEAIREFFFFDGEQLDNYFWSDRSKNIEHNIFILSHIDILQKMKDRLDEKQRSLKKAAGKLNDDVDDISEKLDKEKIAEVNETKRKNDLEHQVIIANNRISELNKLLRGVPDIEKLEKERDKFKGMEKTTEENIKNKKLSLNNLFLLEAPSILSYSLISDVLDEIEKKEDAGDLPPPIDKDIINDSLAKHTCKVCGRELDIESEEFLNNSLTRYEFSSKQSKLLMKLKTPLILHKRRVEEFSNKKKSILQDLKEYRDNSKEIAEHIKSIDKQIVGYDDGSVKKNYRERAKLEVARDDYNKSIGNAETNLKIIGENIDKLEKKLKEAMENDEKTKELNKKRQLCVDALDVINKTQNTIMEETRETIQNWTKNIFFDLLWKKETYSDILIDESYDLKLIHSVTNDNALGSASAAERELLALSFTLGIHKISGFDSPLIIDTPLARVSDEHRENFANVFLEVSNNKQIILLFTPAEYSEDVENLFVKNHVADYEISMGSNETQSDITEGYDG